MLGVEIGKGKSKWLLVSTYWDVREGKRNEDIIEDLEELVRNKNNVMVGGDMNAHIRELDGRSNKNGERLREWRGLHLVQK